MLVAQVASRAGAACSFLALALVGCGALTPTADAGSDGGVDASVPLPVIEGDYHCVPELEEVAGDPIDVPFHVELFPAGASPVVPLDSLCFAEHGSEMDCTHGCSPIVPLPTTLSLLAAGRYDICAIPTDSTQLPLLLVHARAPTAAGSPLVGFTVSDGLLEGVAAVLNFTRAEGAGVIGGRVFGCDGLVVGGAQIRLSTESGESLDSQVRFGFFEAPRVPTLGATTTQPATGLFGIANVPIVGSARRVRVEAWGVLSDGAEPVPVGCEVVTVLPDGFTQVDLGPLHDYPDRHPCQELAAP